MKYNANSPLRYLPDNTVSLTRFLSMAQVPESIGVRHVLQGIDGERIAVTKIDQGSRTVRYLTPDQQRAAFEFWKKHGIAHRRPVVVGGSEATP